MKIGLAAAAWIDKMEKEQVAAFLR